jgi:hypothetical protein
VGHRDHDEDDQQRGEQPVDHEGQERQLEHVEPDVAVELRVLDAEVAAVGEQEPRVPLGRHAGAGDEGQHPGHDAPDPTGPLGHEVVVALEQLVLGARQPVRRGDAVRDEQVGPAEHEEDGDEDDGEDHLGPEHAPPHPALVDRVVPEEVGVEARDPPQ